MSEPIKSRYDFVFYFDVENGNPNGDPDAGNMPRIDPQTGYGLTTDVCLKRKVRNFIEYAQGDATGYDIYVTQGAVLNRKQEEAYRELGLTLKKDIAEEKERAQAYMCQRYFDIRTFGAVMDTGDAKCGQVRGPVQFCFGRSIDPIYQQEVTITRMASTTERDNATENRTMGRKYIVPYALYRMEGFISAKLAEKTGFSEADLELLFTALMQMFEHDRSAARGKMTARRLLIFKHDSALGNVSADKLFATVSASLKDPTLPPRSFSDYQITVNWDDNIQGVELQDRTND